MKKDRNYKLDLLRILCCFAVVVIHYCSKGLYSTEVKSLEWLTFNIFDGFSRFSVPVFFMISGALFLNSNKDISFKELFKKNILKLLIILMIWLPIYGIHNFYLYGGQNLNISSFITIIKGFTTNQFQFWFLFPLISIYLVLPILKQISKNRDVMKYFIILYFIFQILRNTLSLIIGTGAKFQLINLFVPEMMLGYVGYFFLGYYIYSSEFWKSKKGVYISIALFVVGSISNVLIASYLSFINNHISDFIGLFQYYALPTFIASIGVFNIFNNLKLKNLNQFFKKIIENVSNCTMGVYILQIVLILEFGKTALYHTIYLKYLFVTIPIFCFLIFLICILVTFVIKKIPIVGKYIL